MYIFTKDEEKMSIEEMMELENVVMSLAALEGWVLFYVQNIPVMDGNGIKVTYALN